MLARTRPNHLWRLTVAMVPLVALLALPAAASRGVPPSAKPANEPVVCDGNRDLVVSGRSIITDGDGLRVRGNCTLVLEDSHIIANGQAVRVEGNGDVIIRNSFLQGTRGALVVTGNGSASFRETTTRGDVRATGNADLIDAGGNTREKIPEPAHGPLEPREPLRCDGQDRIALVRVEIDSPDDAVVVAGDCDLLVSDSDLRAGGAAIRVLGNGSVRIRNSTLEGAAALALDDRAEADAAGSNFVGRIDLDPNGSARFHEGGGNADGRASPRRQAQRSSHRNGTPDAVHGDDRGHGPAHGSIQIDAGGISIGGGSRDGGGTVRVDRHGVSVQGGTADRGRAGKPITDCADLCARWPTADLEETTCTVAWLDSRGYPVLDERACVDVRGERHCQLCSARLDLEADACQRIAQACFGAG